MEKYSLGWPYGFKLPIITNNTGGIGIIDSMVTKGNIDDRKPLKSEHFIAKLYDKSLGDEGYIPKNSL